jgi:D-3-phosphoglycerate dehydrogenase / 2-oxoglutarate reductase
LLFLIEKGANVNAATPRLVVFTERDEGPVCGLDERTILAAGGALRFGTASGQAERLRMTEPAEVIIVSSAPMTREFLSALPRLKGIVRSGIGVDTVDLQAATDLGIVVANVLDFCQDEVSEHALGLMLAVARKIVLADRKTRSGGWVAGLQESMLPMRRLKGQTLGLVGFGRIARGMATRAKGLGLEVIASDPYVSPETAEALGVRLLPLAELLPEADIISLHVPLSDETRHLINREAFALMRHGTILINASRGAVVDEVALEEALAEGRLAGAGLDVLEQEPIKLPHPLLDFDNVVVTCHYASCSLEAYAEMRRAVSDQTAQILRGDFPKYLVNVQVKNLPQCRLRGMSSQSGPQS